VLARHGQKAISITPIHLLKGDANTVPLCLIGRSLMGAVHNVFIGTDCVQHAQTILPDENPGTEGTQLSILLMHANCPATAMKSDCSSEPSKASASNLRVHVLSPSISSRRDIVQSTGRHG